MSWDEKNIFIAAIKKFEILEFLKVHFQLDHINAYIKWDQFSTYGCSGYLLERLFIKLKVILLKTKSAILTNFLLGFSGQFFC